jgi:hypothetical protein
VSASLAPLSPQLPVCLHERQQTARTSTLPRSLASSAFSSPRSMDHASLSASNLGRQPRRRAAPHKNVYVDAPTQSAQRWSSTSKALRRRRRKPATATESPANGASNKPRAAATGGSVAARQATQLDVQVE